MPAPPSLKPLRILHVTPFFGPAPGLGGIARATAGLAREQCRRGHFVTVISSTASLGPRVEDGVRVRRLPGLGPARLRFCPGAARALREELSGVDVVHLHGHRHGLAAATLRACARAGRPYVLQPHGTSPDHGQHRTAKRAYDAVIGRRVLARAALRLAVSEAEAREIGRAAVVGNGVDAPGRPRPARRAGPPRVLFVGNASHQKRAAVLPALLAALGDAELALVGPGLDRLSFTPGQRVDRRGVLSDAALWDAYQDADVLVAPGTGEAFGLVAFEAALLGTPAVVAGDHGAGEWFARAGGRTAKADDIPTFAAAVREELADPSRAARVAAFVEEHLRWPGVAARVEELYRAVPA